MRRLWTVEEVHILTETAYIPVLRAEQSGQDVIKADALRAAERRLPGRTHHTLKDRCYRISEVLRDEGLPWVQGWKPPEMGGQRRNSAGTTEVIKAGALSLVRTEFGH